MTVTPLDANHCPGSVMFLFEGYFGTILHTGDFRFQPQMFDPGSKLLEVKDKVDVLYLDDTYCLSSRKFPPRDECIKMIIDIISKIPPKYDVLIGTRNLGKEYLLREIAEHFKVWISVHPNMYSNMKLLELPDFFKNNDKQCRIRAVPIQFIRSKINLNEQRPIIGIRPTGLNFDEKPRPSDQIQVHNVPLSDHSSFIELVEFVSTLRPRDIKANVNKNADMSCFKQYMYRDLSASQTVSVPPSVQEYMSSSQMPLGRNVRRKQKGAQRRLKKVPVKGVVYNEEEDVKSQNSSISTSSFEHSNTQTEMSSLQEYKNKHLEHSLPNSMEDQEDPLIALLAEADKQMDEMQPSELSKVGNSVNNTEMSISYYNSVEQHQKDSSFARKLELSETCTINSCETMYSAILQSDDNEMQPEGNEKDGEKSLSPLSGYCEAKRPCNTTKQESNSITVNEHHSRESATGTSLSKPINDLKTGQKKKECCKIPTEDSLHSSAKDNDTQNDYCVKHQSEYITQHYNHSEAATLYDKPEKETVISKASEINNIVVWISDESDMSIDEDADSSDQHKV